MRQEITIALIISVVAIASGCVGSNDASPDRSNAEEIEETQEEVLEDSETLQTCTGVTIELLMVEGQLVIQQTSGAEPVGEVEIEVETSSGDTVSRTVTIETERGTAGVSINGEVESATAEPVNCRGAGTATYP